MKSFTAHTSRINRIKQSPFNKDLVATCSEDNTVKIWNATTTNNWNLIRTYSGHGSRVYGLEWIDQDTIASGSDNKDIKIWSRSTGTTIRTINVDIDVFCLKLLSNGFHLASGLDSGQVKIYDKNDGTLFRTLSGHSGLINDLALTNNGNLLASSSADNTICIWNLTTNTKKFTLTGHNSPVYGLKMISNEILASGSFDKSIILWNIISGYPIRTLPNTHEIYWSVDLLNDAVTLVSGTKGGLVEQWNVNDGSSLRSINTGMAIWTLTILNITEASTSNKQSLIKSIKLKYKHKKKKEIDSILCPKYKF
jgi:WD40 repeat protein